MSLAPLAGKWLEFGWNVREVDGHDVGAVIEALGEMAPTPGPHPSPSPVITQGRGGHPC
jgi:transketolase